MPTTGRASACRGHGCGPAGEDEGDTRQEAAYRKLRGEGGSNNSLGVAEGGSGRQRQARSTMVTSRGSTTRGVAVRQQGLASYALPAARFVSRRGGAERARPTGMTH
jgi:hypothetical protein